MSVDKHMIVAPGTPLPASGELLAAFLTDLHHEKIIGDRYTLLGQDDAAYGGASSSWVPGFPHPANQWEAYVHGPVLSPSTVVEGWIDRWDEERRVAPALTVYYDGPELAKLLEAVHTAEVGRVDLVILANVGAWVNSAKAFDAVAILALAAPLTIGAPHRFIWSPYITIDGSANVLEPAGAVFDSMEHALMIEEGVLPEGYSWTHPIQTCFALWAHGGGQAWQMHQAPLAHVLRRHLTHDLREGDELW